MKNPKSFSFEVREIIFEHAQEIAAKLGHRQVEPEDLLIATTRAASAAPVFRRLGIEPAELEKRLFDVAPRGTHATVGKREYSVASGRRTMRMWAEARRRGIEEVGAAEFLVAILEPPPRRFLFVFPRRIPPFWAALEAAGITETSVQKAIADGAA